MEKILKMILKIICGASSMLTQLFVLNVLFKKKRCSSIYISGYFSFSRLISWLRTMFFIIDVQIVKEDAEPLKNFPGEPKMPARWAWLSHTLTVSTKHIRSSLVYQMRSFWLLFFSTHRACNLIFFKNEMNRLKKEIPITKKRFQQVSQMWKSLSSTEKESYKAMANERLLEYTVELQNWFKVLEGGYFISFKFAGI